jgi:hypothetical protein
MAGRAEAAPFNMAQKMARLKALRENGRMDEPANEAVAGATSISPCMEFCCLHQLA